MTKQKRSSRKFRRTRRVVRLPRSAKELAAKPASFQDAYAKTIGALKKMREKRLSFNKAAAELKIDPRTAARIGASGLRKTKSGRYVARPDDKLLRTIRVEALDGTRVTTVRGFKEARKGSAHANAVNFRAYTGDTSAIQKFEGATIVDEDGNQIPLLTDPAEIDRRAHAGDLSYETMYLRSA